MLARSANLVGKRACAVVVVALGTRLRPSREEVAGLNFDNITNTAGGRDRNPKGRERDTKVRQGLPDTSQCTSQDLRSSVEGLENWMSRGSRTRVGSERRVRCTAEVLFHWQHMTSGTLKLPKGSGRVNWSCREQLQGPRCRHGHAGNSNSLEPRFMFSACGGWAVAGLGFGSVPSPHAHRLPRPPFPPQRRILHCEKCDACSGYSRSD